MPAQGEIDVMKYGKYRPDMYTDWLQQMKMFRG